MSPESHKIRTDADLQRLFPEHEWRRPIPLKFMNDHQLVRPFGCAFCVYRYGLDPDHGAHRFSSEAGVRFHLEQSHA